ncbi:MAG: serine protease [Wenzhouxiangellaceae bacterium]|nr:serine protease [Wenzhouxiangellaceae bacterium]
MSRDAETTALPLLALLVAMLLVPAGSLRAQAGEYGALFERLKPALFTVEVVERDSGNKAAIGTAFLVTGDGRLATNYHVVSEHMLDPDRYGLRYRDADDGTGPLRLVDVDVLHDLAVVEFAEAGDRRLAPPFALADALPAIGESVLALGNPYDIGIGIVPGTFNGLATSQYRSRIHFTGALNPGMSGGPAVDREGAVIGVNVAAAGNSVSFLVPVEHLVGLLERLPEAPSTFDAMRSRVTERILAHQAEMIDRLLEGDWSGERFGPMRIPREIRPWIRCTGTGRDRDPETPWSESHSNCSLDDRIYLSRSLDTGTVELVHGWYRSDGLAPLQFARIPEQTTFLAFNRTGENDVTDFECVEGWTRHTESPAWKATWCLRAYVDYPGLHDVLYVARVPLAGTEAVHLHYTLAGVPRDAALAFHRRFVDSVDFPRSGDAAGEAGTPGNEH